MYCDWFQLALGWWRSVKCFNLSYFQSIVSVCVCVFGLKVLCSINSICLLPQHIALERVSVVFFGSPLQPAAKSKPISSFWFSAGLVLSCISSYPLHMLRLRGRKWGFVEGRYSQKWRGRTLTALEKQTTVKQLPFQSYCNTVKYLFCAQCFSLGWSKNGVFFFSVCFAAMHQALDTLSDSTSSTTANDLDLIFLKGIMESPVVMRSLFYTLWNIYRPSVCVFLYALVCHSEFILFPAFGED